MMYAGLDLSRQGLDVHILDDQGRTVATSSVTPDQPGLSKLASKLRLYGQEISATDESMNGARFIHDQLQLLGWDVELADRTPARLTLDARAHFIETGIRCGTVGQSPSDRFNPPRAAPRAR